MDTKQKDLAALIHQALFSTNKVANLVRFDIVEVANTVAKYLLQEDHNKKLKEIINDQAITSSPPVFALWLFGYKDDDFREQKYATALAAYQAMRSAISKDAKTKRYRSMMIFDLTYRGNTEDMKVRWARTKFDECFISDKMVKLIGEENIC